MKHNFVKVAAITPQVKIANPAANAAAISRLIKETASSQIDLTVFPEMCITGYSCGELFLSNLLIKETIQALKTILEASKKSSALIFVGAPILFKSKLFSCAVALQKGKLLGIIPKTAIPGYGEFYEPRHFSSGENICELIDIAGATIPFSTNIIFQANNEDIRVSAEICEDMFIPNPPSVSHALAGANIIVNLSASNELIAKSDYRQTLIKAQSGRLAAGYVYTSAGTSESVSDMIFSGHRVIAENGVILSEGEIFEDGVTVSEIDIDRLAFERRRLNVFKSEQGHLKIPFELEIKSETLTRQISPLPFVPSDTKQLSQRAELILTMQSRALAERLKFTGLDAVIGLSGGLDSTLALLVILRAYDFLKRPKNRIIAITMPGPGTSQKTLSNVLALSKAVGISVRNIPISEAVDAHLKAINHEKEDIAYENAQARERTQILMDIANAQKGLVVGTGDLSEFALGWCTYNGDHMSMYAVNSSVPKTLVKFLVSYEAGRVEKYKSALTDVLETEISPELLPHKGGKISQKTEELIGPYELHDFFLYYFARFGLNPAKIIFLAQKAFRDKYEKRAIEKYLRIFLERFFKNQFKRNCVPDGVKIGSISLSPRADWRMPSEADPKAWTSGIKSDGNSDS